MYKIRTHEIFLLSYQLGEVKRRKKFYNKILLRHLSAELSSTETKNWEQIKSAKSGWLDPLYHDMCLKVCYKVNLMWNRLLKNRPPKITLQMSFLCQYWEHLRAHVFSVNLYRLYLWPATIKFRSVSQQNFFDFFGFGG